MTTINRSIGITLLSASLIFGAGCNTPGNGAATGAVFGGALGAVIGAATGRPALGAAIGMAAGATTGAIIGSINREQQARLRRESPQTLEVVMHNDAVYQQQQQLAQQQQQQAAAQPTAQGQQQPAPAPAANLTPTPLSVDDIKALDASGLKKDVIIAEIQKSNAVYTAQDIATLQQNDPTIDPAIIDFMKKSHS
jgi:outer membrane lipoprotein SlyB